MRCPSCNKKVTTQVFTKGICKKCGYKFKFKDFLKPNWQCPLFDLCNDWEECNDSDWEHCATHVNFKNYTIAPKLFIGKDLFEMMKAYLLEEGYELEIKELDHGKVS